MCGSGVITGVEESGGKPFGCGLARVVSYCQECVGVIDTYCNRIGDNLTACH